MKTTCNMVENVANAMVGIDVGGKKGDAALTALDRGILEVSLMIAGLDGTILPAEYAAFVTLSKAARGATAANTRSAYDSSIAKAGRIAAMARSGLYSESARLATFVRLSREALPKGFACGSLADMRRAFALWIAMGVSDGAFSAFEKRCVQALVRAFALARAGKARRFAVVLESDFFAKAERIFRDMGVPARCAKAEAALDALVSKVAVRTKAGLARHESMALALSVPMPGPIVTGWK